MRDITIILLALSIIMLGFRVCQLEDENKRLRKELAAAVHTPRILTRAIDGDTVELDGGERVRIIGIDTPETWKKTGGKWERIADPDPRGVAAYEFLRSFEGQTVRLSYESRTRDRYGRTLAHVYETAEGLDLASEIIRRGWAKIATIKPNTRRYGDYKEMQARTRPKSAH